ncbi:MAG: hypothetical protein HC818_05890, partial [Synechococcaceae cyanobacterium RM1_1_27]|nr:hypothetical protein [Synechococcaceae cyanobacterium RM1_1_27]
QRDVRIDGVYQMFVHDVDFDRVQLERFLGVMDRMTAANTRLGKWHAAATYELHRLPEAHLDTVRVGNALARPASSSRAVCSRPAGSPMISFSRASTFMWMSSSSGLRLPPRDR